MRAGAQRMAVAVGALALAATACGGSSDSAAESPNTSGGSSAAANGTPVKVGIIYPKTGLLAEYGAEYIEGLKVGLDYATNGTGAAGGHKIELTEMDGAGDPTKAVSEAKDLIGQGYKILAGPGSSGVAVQLAPIAAQNKVLLISGPAATDAITGINKYTFRSGRETYQDVKTAASTLGDVKGKSVLVFAQDYEFGQANATAVKAVLGGAGAHVDQLLVPLSATDITPFAQQIKQKKPDLLFVAWAGASTAGMWKALDQQGVFDATKVTTGLANTASYGAYGSATEKIDFLSHYFASAPDNAVNTAMVDAIKADGKAADIFSPDGFVAAQMIVRAVEKADGEDVDKMITALEGWTFDAPKGSQTVRAEDHAMLQPMFVAHLVKDGATFVPKLVTTVPADEVAPPVKPFGSAS